MLSAAATTIGGVYGVRVRCLSNVSHQGSKINIRRDPLITTHAGWAARVAGACAEDKGDLLVRDRTDLTNYHVVDFIVTAPIRHVFKNAHVQAGEAAVAGWTAKELSYSRRFTVPQGKLIPFVAEAGGRVHKKSLE